MEGEHANVAVTAKAPGSSSNPLKKLKKKFNKLKRSESLRTRSSTKSKRLVAEDSVSNGSFTVELSGDGVSTSPFRHQDSFQSTGTATSLLTRTFEDSSAYSSCGDDNISDSLATFENDPSRLESAAADDGLKEMMALSAEQELSTLVDEPLLEDMPSGTRLELTLVSGCDLIAHDRNGFSDPYVKVKYRDRTVYKTKVVDKNLNPLWEETCNIAVEDLAHPIIIRVYDHDTFSGDDFMGTAAINLTQLDKDRPVDLSLELTEDIHADDDGSVGPSLGQINVRCFLHFQTSGIVKPITAQGKSLMSNIMKADTDLHGASEWDYIVRVVLLEGSDLLAMDDNGRSDPYVRFKLQSEKYKTKVKNKTLSPKWMEAFSLHLYDRKSWDLDIRVFDHNIAGRADFMGRTTLDLSTLEVDKTHDITVHLEDEAGSLRILITITGAVSSTDHEISTLTRAEITRRYGLLKSFRNFKDVGWLQLKVIRAHGLSSKDWDGKSDPFCTVELVNTQLQSHTAYNTLNPEWNRVFTMPVKDIHSVLEVTVYDEDRDMKKEFIGKVAIPLIMVENGVQKWYGLKDRKLFNRVKGEVLLELDMVFNHVKAAVRTFNPREEHVLQEEPKFKISLFRRNVNRVRAIGSSIVSARNFWQSLVDWDYPSKTMMAFVAFMVAVWNFELYMLPMTMIMLFLWNLVVREIKGNSGDDMVQFETDMDEEDADEEDDDREAKRSFREYIDVVKSICCTIQEMLGKIADHGEAIKNSVNWTVPWLSRLAVVALSVIMLILYMIPFRYIVLLWGINKFTKKLRKPNYIPNNEVLDYLSRVPSDVEKVMYKEIRADPDRGRSGSPQPRSRKSTKAK